ncbi:hypothetical protein [Novosphingobium rosa]|uniref:hypothetical protein n=1 Tax=Novosphingobium rosa TaxID=76978 RepID=UPI00082FDC66|nr:hypothetical protein [Novosphingobium rosa]
MSDREWMAYDVVIVRCGPAGLSAAIRLKQLARDAGREITVGLQPVPFDERWWGTTFFNSLGFVYGMEEVYDVGVTVSHKQKNLALDFGYFPTTAPNAFGISKDSACYTINSIKGDSYAPNATQSAERNMVVGRAQYTVPMTGKAKLTLNGSAWISAIHNYDTGRDGYRHSFALSGKLEVGPWHLRMLAARQDIDPRNGGRDDLITVGDYDSSFNIATKGALLQSELGRKIDMGRLPVTLTAYANYGRFVKSAPGFDDSERLTLGGFWTDKASGRLRVWIEMIFGRNDPYVGAGQFISGAAQGGDGKIKTSMLILVGYYF